MKESDPDYQHALICGCTICKQTIAEYQKQLNMGIGELIGGLAKEKPKLLTEKQIIEKYGQPGDTKNFTLLNLPYPMRLAWDVHVIVNKIQCHKLILTPLLAVFKDLLAAYGLVKIQELGIDLYGGCVNVRLMRGSKTKWSRHSWGIAIDLDPARNGLKLTWKQSQFSKPEYKKMVDIFSFHGFISYGRDRDFDAMHFEVGV